MRKWLVLLFLAVLLAGAAPLLATCTSGDWHQELSYAGPTEISIDKGQFLASTDIQYLAKAADGAQVSIGGQPALKKIGDSLDWKGTILAGVTVDESLRVVLISEETLHTAGTVRVDIATPSPQAEPVNESAPVHFKLPVAYRVDQDAAIPGTVITYLGKTDQGARLDNIQGYEYRQAGDSITWQGKLRDGVWLDLNLRTVLILDGSLDVAGTADVWLVPSGTPGQ
jgi:hypothetical protein